jgi:glucose/mannose-6-phosphate isomerase
MPLNENSRILQKIVNLPEQMSEAIDLTRGQIDVLSDLRGRKFSNIVILGMGGSGIAGDIAKILLRNYPISIEICKNPIPPALLNDRSLVVAITYSGRTYETLKALDAAKSVGARIIVISSSGELQHLCHERGMSFIQIPPNNIPRASLGYMLVPLLTIFQQVGALPSGDLDLLEAISIVNKIKSECGPHVLARANPARLLAHTLVGTYPVIYGESDFTDIVARRWKQQLNENSKVHCYCESFPELLHNEIESWYADNNGVGSDIIISSANVVSSQDMSSKSHQPNLILLRDLKHEQQIDIAEKVDATKELVSATGAKVMELWSKGKSELARLLSLVYIGDLVSVYLAIYKGVDASSIPNIDHLKKIGPAQTKLEVKSELFCPTNSQSVTESDQ